MNRSLGPREAAAGANCTPDYLRHVRRCRHLDGLGVRESKMVVYSVGEIIRIATAFYLSTRGFELRRAFEAVAERGAQIEALGNASALRSGADLVLHFGADDPSCSALVVNVTVIAERVRD